MSFEGWSPIAVRYSPLKAGSIDGTDKDAHDRAIIRALCAKYRPNKAVVGNPQCTLFVSRLHPNTTEETIRDTFSKYGDFKRVRLVRDMVTGFSKCYAFVEYEERKSAIRAHRETYRIDVDGQEIFVDFEQERILEGWVPRRFGGGLGGKKESGQLRFGGRDRPFRKPILMETGTRTWQSGPPDDNYSRRTDDREQDRPTVRYERNSSRDRRNFCENYKGRTTEDETDKRGRYRSPTRSIDKGQNQYKPRSQRDFSPAQRRTDNRRRSRSRSRERYYRSGRSGRY